MRRYLFVLATSTVPLPLAAQDGLAGIAVDSASGAPLPCVEVALVDSSDRTMAVARTARDGVFQFLVSPTEHFRLRFSIDAHLPVWTPRMVRRVDPPQIRSYQVRFATRQPDAELPAPSTAPDAPAWPLLSESSAIRYPTDLVLRRVPGRVVAQFVVDTAGHVMPGTARMLESSHPAFARAVRDQLPGQRYSPARRAHRPICSLVQQTFDFAISR